jgi:hypothetical protein
LVSKSSPWEGSKDASGPPRHSPHLPAVTLPDRSNVQPRLVRLRLTVVGRNFALAQAANCGSEANGVLWLFEYPLPLSSSIRVHSQPRRPRRRYTCIDSFSTEISSPPWKLSQRQRPLHCPRAYAPLLRFRFNYLFELILDNLCNF